LSLIHLVIVFYFRRAKMAEEMTRLKGEAGLTRQNNTR
jgi:hypothetical protein